MKSIKKFIIPVTASALLLGACGNNATSSKDSTLISSSAGDVKVEDVLKKIGNEQVASSSFQILLNKILEDKYKDSIDEKKIDKEVDKEIKQYGGKDQFEKLLKQKNLTVDDYKDQKKLAEYQNKLLADNVKVTDEDIKKESKKASHILVKVKENDKDKEGLSDADAKKKAEDILKQVKKDPSKFGDIAKKESDDTASAKEKGSLGYVLKGQMVKPFEKALFDLKEDEISGVVKTDYGYHVIKADKPTDFDSEKSKLRDQIIQSKVQKDPELLTKALEKLLKEYKVDYKDRDIKKAIEDSVLNPDKLKQQSQEGAAAGGQQ